MNIFLGCIAPPLCVKLHFSQRLWTDLLALHFVCCVSFVEHNDVANTDEKRQSMQVFALTWITFIPWKTHPGKNTFSHVFF